MRELIPLSQDFYSQATITVARQLLGTYLVRHDEDVLRIGRIVEVEAYLGPNDLAAHSSKGITKRTQIMFGPPGYAYVYLIYGIYHCFNVVTEGSGSGTAVLIRAIEPVTNLDSRTQGPGLLCRAMNITRALNGHSLQDRPLFISSLTVSQPLDIVERPRIGVSYAKDWADKLLRFYIKDNLYVSKK